MDQVLGKLDRAYTYWSMLAKIMNCWRERASNIYEEWLALAHAGKCTVVQAVQCAGRVAPRPLVGRWGSASRCELFLLKCDVSLLCLVWQHVYQSPQKPVHQREGGLDELAADEQRAYQEKIGKWARESTQGLSDPCFWLVLRLSKILKEPLDHFLHILMQTRHGEPSNLAELVWGRGAQIRGEIEKLLDTTSPAWADLLAQAEQHGLRTVLLGCVRREVLGLLADYDRRVMHRINSSPYDLLWFAHAPPNQRCEQRMRVAKQVIGSDDSFLHATACKVKSLFPLAVKQAADTGTISVPLYTIFQRRLAQA